jgi:hypothetical protein
MPDGVIHCVRVRTGRDGVRGRKREILEAATAEWTASGPDDGRLGSAPACAAGRPWPHEARDWAFATLVEVESVGLGVYQASQVQPAVSSDPPTTWLVEGKPTVARVYTHWPRKDWVNVWSQVRDFPARVSVERGNSPITAPRRTTIRRPDLFDWEDRRHARHTVNLFGWRPVEYKGGSDLRAVVEPVDAAARPVRRFESPVQRLAHWHASPILKLDYYYLRVNGCATGMHPC